MIIREPLAPVLRPREFRVVLSPVALAALDRSEVELTAEAEANEQDRCFGHFPGLRPTLSASETTGVDLAAIKHDLPASDEFQRICPAIAVGRWQLGYNFLRLALQEQPGSEGTFHLDRGAEAAVNGDPATLSQRVVWRALGNVSSECERTLEYLDMQASEADLIEHQYLCAGMYDKDCVRSVSLGPRRGPSVGFVVFPSSRVWHTGGTAAHFVAAYGAEEIL